MIMAGFVPVHKLRSKNNDVGFTVGAQNYGKILGKIDIASHDFELYFLSHFLIFLSFGGSVLVITSES